MDATTSKDEPGRAGDDVSEANCNEKGEEYNAGHPPACPTLKATMGSFIDAAFEQLPESTIKFWHKKTTFQP